MRRDRKSSIRKERITMITSSVFVLAALTMTGIYIKNQNTDYQDDGYTIDFTALRDELPEQEILKDEVASVTEDDLDYMPMEVDSGLVEIPGLTDAQANLQSDAANTSEKSLTETMYEKALQEKAKAESALKEAKNAVEELPQLVPGTETPMEQEVQSVETDGEITNSVSREFFYSEETGLLRPVTGDIMMHYSMDGSIYFATLDQYKYNPAVIFQAAEGTQVEACAAGKVVAIYQNAELGQVVTIDLGNGYQATYGQLRDLGVTMDSYVEPGTIIGFVNTPTKYYSVEGSNLYFKLTKDGEAVNPESLFY